MNESSRAPAPTAREASPGEPQLEGTSSLLALRRYGEVLAYALHFPAREKAEVLARLGLREHDWYESDQHWRAELAAEVVREETALGAVFGAAFAAARAKLRRERPALEALGPRPASAEKAPPAAPPSTAEAIGATPSTSAETAAQDGLPPEPEPQTPPDAPGAAPPPQVSVPVQMTPSYLKAPPAAPPPAPAAVPPLPRPVSPGPSGAKELATETGSLDLAQLFKPVVPFDPTRSAEAASPLSREQASSRPVPRAREPFATETGALDPSDLLKPVVPFEKAAPSSPGMHEVQAAPEKKSPRHESTETVEFDVATLLKGRAPVPFEKAVAHPKTAPMPAVTSATPTIPAQAPPTAPETPGPRRRLIRFDPQTGAPLATPYWQDLPSTEDKKR